MQKAKLRKKSFPIFIALFLLTSVIVWRVVRPYDLADQSVFDAPGRDWPSQKKVEDYFVEKLRMTPKDLARMHDRETVSLRLTKNSTVNGLTGNLYYYGFVRDEKAFRYALEHTVDTLPGKDGALRIGTNGTIDINASYRISENMSSWKIADTLLNKPEYFSFDEYGYLFMP